MKCIKIGFLILFFFVANEGTTQTEALKNLLSPQDPYASITQAPDSFLLSIRPLEFSYIEEVKMFPDAIYPQKDFRNVIKKKAAHLITPKMVPVKYFYDPVGMLVYQENDVQSYNEEMARHHNNSKFKFRYELKSKFDSRRDQVTIDTAVLNTFEVQKGKSATNITLEEVEVKYLFPFAFDITIYKMGTDSILHQQSFEKTYEWKNTFIPYDGKIKDLPKAHRKLARRARKRPKQKNINIKQYSDLKHKAVNAVIAFLDKNFVVPKTDNAAIGVVATGNTNADEVPATSNARQPNSQLPSYLSQLEDRTPATTLLNSFQENLGFAHSAKGFVATEGQNYKIWVYKNQLKKINWNDTFDTDKYYKIKCLYCKASCSTCPAQSFDGIMYWAEHSKNTSGDFTDIIKKTDYNMPLDKTNRYRLLDQWEVVDFVPGKTMILDQAKASFNGAEVKVFVSRAYYLVKEGKRDVFDDNWKGKEAARDFVHVIFENGDTVLEMYQPVGASMKLHVSKYETQPVISDYRSAIKNLNAFTNKYIELK